MFLFSRAARPYAGVARPVAAAPLLAPLQQAVDLRDSRETAERQPRGSRETAERQPRDSRETGRFSPTCGGPNMAARTASCGPRLFTLSGCVNRWLWSDSTHRRLGVLAFGAALTAYASGLLGWRALPPLVARCCAGLVALIGASTLGGHGVRVRDDPRFTRDGPRWPEIRRCSSTRPPS